MACHVSRMLETPPCMLRSLDLSSSRIADEGAYMLRDALTEHPTMRSLDLSRNRIGITGGQALASLLVGDSGLASLRLRANLIGDEGAMAFKIVLLHSQTLTTYVCLRIQFHLNRTRFPVASLFDGRKCDDYHLGLDGIAPRTTAISAV